MEIKGALTLPNNSTLLDVAAKQLEEYGAEMLRERGWKLSKCCSCGHPIWEKSWHEPPSCPYCHASRVD